MPRHRGLYYSMWQACSICGFPFPITELTMQKGGLRDAKCLDNLDVEYRPKIITEMLGDTQETENERIHVADDPNTIEF